MAFGLRQANLVLAYKIAAILLWAEFPLVRILVCSDISSNLGPASMPGRTSCKISAQPHTTLRIQFLNRENNDKNNTLPLGKQICFTIVWGCEEILPPIQPLTRISVDFGLLARHGRKLPLETTR